MDRKEHVIVTETVFGDGYDEVHKWIDSDAGNWFNTGHSVFRHWVKYHNHEALKEKYGEGSIEFNVGILHIICDWMSHLNKFHIPETSGDVTKLLMDYELWW